MHCLLRRRRRLITGRVWDRRSRARISCRLDLILAPMRSGYLRIALALKAPGR